MQHTSQVRVCQLLMITARTAKQISRALLAVNCHIHQRSESFITSFIQFAHHDKTTYACHGSYCTCTSSNATSLMLMLLKTVHASSPPWLAEPNVSFSGRWHPAQAVLACLSDLWLPLASPQPWLSPAAATQPTSGHTMFAAGWHKSAPSSS